MLDRLSNNNVNFLAGSKLESVIVEGPEALQKYIDSGEIEELHDVMPIKDDDEDYLNDYDSNDELHPTTTGVTTNHPPVATDSDMRNMDQDMRNFNFPLDSNMHGDSDYRSNVNRDLNFQPPPHDYDMRNEMGDEDFREFNRDQDYRHYDESEEGYEDYYEDSRGGSWRSNGDYNNRDYNSRGQNNFEEIKTSEIKVEGLTMGETSLTKMIIGIVITVETVFGHVDRKEEEAVKGRIKV